MKIYKDLYAFAASAGAFEGYVYLRDKVNPDYLPRWVDNLVNQYKILPPTVLAEIQDLCDGTLGRAVRSLIPVLGEDHEVVGKLKGLIRGEMPSSPDDFSRDGKE